MNTNHSKVIATLIICLALIGSVLIYDKKESLFAQKPAGTANVVVDNSSLNMQGANEDWKKSLNTVSDPIQIVVTQNSTADTEIDNTLTGQISKEFFSLYLADKKNGVTVDQNEAVNIANQTINNLNINFQGKQYGLTDIQINQDTSAQAMNAYGLALSSAIKNNSTHKSISPLTVINTASQSQKDSDLNGIDLVASDYQGAIAAILKIPVPVKMAGYHLVYLNTLSDILYDLQAMRKILNDPVVGYVGFSNYQKDTIKMSVVAQNIVSSFSQ